MMNRCQPRRLAGIALLVALCWNAAAGDARPVEVPDFALGVLTVRQIGTGLDKLGTYASKIYPASGELAKKFSSNKLFPDVPLNAGFKADGTALIYVLDPVKTGIQNERAMILPVTDATAVKAALVSTLGMPAEDGGVLTFIMPQPLPNPDKTLLAKFVRNNLLTAPNPTVLKSLEEFLGSKDSSALAAIDADAALTIKVANFKASFGEQLKSSLELGATNAAQNEEQKALLLSQVHDILDTLWQTDVVELRLSLDNEKSIAAIELGFTAQNGTSLANTLTGAPGSVAGKFNNLLPFDPAVLIAWNVNGTEASSVLRDGIKKAVGKDAALGPVQQADKKVAESVTGFVESLGGEVDLAFGARGGKLAVICATQLRDGEKMRKSLTSIYESIAGSLSARAPQEAGKDPIKVDTKAAPDYGGAQISTSSLVVTVPSPQALANNVFALSVAKTRSAFAFAIGPGGTDALKATIDNSNKSAPVPDALQAAFKGLPAGTALMVLIKPITLIRAVGSKKDAVVNAEKLTAGLPDAAASIQVRVSNRTATLRLEIPSAVPGGLIQLSDRLQRAKLSLDDLLRGGPSDVPAPGQ
jgi:hypothetical protein